jgi:LuxR family quorum-sensing system transcriptional regulator CciR
MFANSSEAGQAPIRRLDTPDAERKLRARQKLTQRERECLLLAARGKSDSAIGEVLNISGRTVHHAIERAKQRYGVSRRVQAILHAIAAGEFSAADALEQR